MAESGRAQGGERLNIKKPVAVTSSKLRHMLESLEIPGWFDYRAPMEYYRMRGLTLDDFAKDYSKQKLKGV